MYINTKMNLEARVAELERMGDIHSVIIDRLNSTVEALENRVEQYGRFFASMKHRDDKKVRGGIFGSGFEAVIPPHVNSESTRNIVEMVGQRRSKKGRQSTRRRRGNRKP